MSKRKRPQPPHSVEAEQSVLGGLMLDNDRWDEVTTQISAQDFFISSHRTIYSHMQSLVEQGNPIDLITLSESLEQQEQLEQVGGFAYLAELSKNTPSTANIIPYAQYIASYGELRQLLLLGNELSDMAGQAVQLGGSIALISHYFGISTAEISARRRLMGIHVRQGRNQVPGEEEEAALWNRWQEIKVDNIDSIPALEAMMLLAQERSLSLTVVWNLIRQWEKS
ncbi:DUF2857 family protein [Salmonella enterica]